MSERNQGAVITAGGVLSIALVCFAIVAFFLFGVPRYKVWQQEMKGRAELAQAEQNRRGGASTRCCRGYQNREWLIDPHIHPVSMGASAELCGK